MKPLLLLALTALTAFAQEKSTPFELKDGDRVLLLGDALLERENSFGHLETRMHEQFPNAKFSVRNLSWSGETPRGWSRASFDPPEKGFARLKEQIAQVKPTVAILGFGMAASLQEMTDRSGDITLNRDPARYGAEPMSAPRFKKELGELMDAIGKDTRFILLPPIPHEDLRPGRPGLPDPAPHNALLDQYRNAIAELAKERGALFAQKALVTDDQIPTRGEPSGPRTENGIHLTDWGYYVYSVGLLLDLDWQVKRIARDNVEPGSALRAAILKKNDLFFHQSRPANSTYLFGFRKHEQGKNAVEIPQFDPLLQTADEQIWKLKAAAGKPASEPAKTTPAPDQSPITNHQSPLATPTFSTADGLEITLWADTHLVGKPVGMNWDAAGRLWVACSPVYPQIKPGAHPDDKVVVIEDTDRDGKADKTTTFASDLLIAAGVAPDFGGASMDKMDKVDGKAADKPVQKVPSAAYVGASTELLRLEDTDGDGIADVRRAVLSGFGTEDTHHTLHTLRWGPDGRLYFNQSIYIHSHMETPWGMVRLNSGGICAYDPRTERVEVHAKGWCNPWGHAWDQWGQEFVTDGAGFQGISWLVPGAMYFTYENARRIMPSVSPGSYPKYCGLELIQSPLFPADWQGNAITCDFRAHRIARFQINDLGTGATPKSGYVTKELPNPVTTTDSSFRPIDVKLGPDGALYIADWTNPIINHGEVDFRDPRRDHVNGRIWRVAPKGKAGKWEPLNKESALAFAEQVESGNQWAIEQTRRLLHLHTGTVRGLTISNWLKKLIEAGADKSKIARACFEAEFFGQDYSTLTRATDLVKSIDETFPQLRATRARHLSPPPPSMEEILTPMVAAKKAQIAAADYFSTHDVSYSTAIESKTIILADLKKTIAAAKAAQKDTAELSKELEREESGLALITQSRDADERLSKKLNGPLEGWIEDFGNKVPEFLPSLARDPHPRVRLEAMRALSRIPTAESAALVLEAAVSAPGGKDATAALPGAPKQQFDNATASETADSHYAYAAWLSVNDLAPQVAEWVESGAGASPASPNGEAANPKNAAPAKDAPKDGAPRAKEAGEAPAPLPRDAMITYALQTLPSDKSGPLLSKIIAKNGVPKDGSGPWIELIGQAGGPAECRVLLNALLAATRPDGEDMDHLADEKYKFTVKDANRRAAAALVAAARRGVNPANPPYGGWEFHFYAPPECEADVIRLAGLWKVNIANNLTGKISKDAEPAVLDATFEALRTLGTEQAANALTAFLAPQLEKKIDNAFLRHSLEQSSPAIRRRTLAALAAFRPDIALAALKGVLAEAEEPAQLPLWRELFQSPAFSERLIARLGKGELKDLPNPAIALRAARELGKKGEKLVAALTPLTGVAPAAPAAGDVAALVEATKKNGNPVEGELIYRRAALTCTVCHAIGGAGGKVGPDMTTLGASAPLDYIVESLINPAAKVKEGYHAVALTLKGGRAASGVIARETDKEILLRDATGTESTITKADITARENIGSLMPAGLLVQLNDREKSHLAAFLAALGKPGPFDAGKATVARTWEIFPGKDAEAVVAGKAAKPGAKVLTMVDGRLLKTQLTEALQFVPDAGDTIVAVVRFNGSGKTRLNLQGATKAWLDGNALAIASDPNPSVELAAGNHTLAIKLDTKSLPEVLRAECPDARFLSE